MSGRTEFLWIKKPRILVPYCWISWLIVWFIEFSQGCFNNFFFAARYLFISKTISIAEWLTNSLFFSLYIFWLIFWNGKFFQDSVIPNCIVVGRRYILLDIWERSKRYVNQCEFVFLKNCADELICWVLIQHISFLSSFFSLQKK